MNCSAFAWATSWPMLHSPRAEEGRRLRAYLRTEHHTTGPEDSQGREWRRTTSTRGVRSTSRMATSMDLPRVSGHAVWVRRRECWSRSTAPRNRRRALRSRPRPSPRRWPIRSVPSHLLCGLTCCGHTHRECRCPRQQQQQARCLFGVTLVVESSCRQDES